MRAYRQAYYTMVVRPCGKSEKPLFALVMLKCPKKYYAIDMQSCRPTAFGYND